MIRQLLLIVRAHAVAHTVLEVSGEQCLRVIVVLSLLKENVRKCLSITLHPLRQALDDSVDLWVTVRCNRNDRRLLSKLVVASCTEVLLAVGWLLLLAIGCWVLAVGCWLLLAVG